VLLKRIFGLFFVCVWFLSCSTKKNTVVTRGYHNLTARYNGYYYSCEAINDGVFKIETDHKDNFDRLLPIYIYPSAEKAKATTSDFDRAIKKSSLCIQKHAIKNSKGQEVASAGHWIDNNWINIGIAHFYKREFFSGIEAFEYVVRTYTKSQDKYVAMLWLIKSYNEIGSVSNSEQIITLLKNEKRSLSPAIRDEFAVVMADYYTRRGQNTEAIARLMETTRKTNLFTGVPRKKRARYSFIIGQMLEQARDNNRAILFYRKTIKLKPSYEMIFYSKIKVARLQDLKRSNSERTKKDLLKMAKEFKNSDYYDVIYYTLGEIEEREKHIPQAITYYKKSVSTSSVNPNQKALSYLKLGEINFELTNYELAGYYYDSTITTLPKEHPDYNQILARKKTLETLVKHINTISQEDSLQRIAKMSEETRMAFIDKVILQIEQEAERRQKELEKAQNAAANGSGGGGGFVVPGQSTIPGMGGESATFYFYNPNTVAIGIADFTRKWGNRKLEDNWRRSGKAMVMTEDSPENSKETASTDKSPTNSSTNQKSTQNKDLYLKGLPLTDSLMAASHEKIIKAFYGLGSIYKEELNNIPKTIATFEELNRRYPNNKYLLNTYYALYRIYSAEKNTAKADVYKNKILNEFPDSEFALLIRNPEYAAELSAQKSEVETYYASTLDLYKANNYPDAYASAGNGIKKYGKNDYTPKFEFIKAMSLGRLHGADTLEYSLKLLVAKYPNSDVAPISNDILLSIKKQKNPELFKEPEPGKAKTDTFNIAFEAEHFIMAVTVDDTKMVESFKSNLGAFNANYYTEKKFDVSSNLFGQSKQMVLIKSFVNAKEAYNYYENLEADPEVFKGQVSKEKIGIYVISKDNLPLFYKKKNEEGYKLFFQDNYKSLKETK
jgi:tetratricopeptide (TPR) repeat protein